MKKLFVMLLALALVLSFSLVATTPVMAAVINVDDTMSTAAINTAIANAPIGATVKFAAGTYNLDVPLVLGVADVIVEGDIESPGSVIINAATIAGTDRDCFQVKADGVTIRGFRMQGAIDADGGAGYQNAAVVIGVHWDGPAIPGLQNITISHNEITDCTRGIYVYRAQYVTISYNKIWDIKIAGANAAAAWPGKGIELKGDGDPAGPQIFDIKILGNEIHNCQLIGIEINVWEISPQEILDVQVLIDDNTIYNNGGDWTGVGAFPNVHRGIQSNGYTRNVTITNNRIYGHKGETDTDKFSWAIRPHFDTEWTIVNNDIYDNHKGIRAVGDNHTISGNTITGNSIYGIRSTGDNTITGNTIANNGAQEQATYTSCGVWARPGDVIRFNNIHDNGLGVFYDRPDAPALDATHNWWGDASGPGSVGPGTGDEVSDNVNFTPWYFMVDPDPDIPITSYGELDDTATGTGPASFGASEGTIQNLRAVPEATLPLAGKPRLAFPHGFFALDIEGVTQGGEITVSIMLPEDAHPDTEYWKYYSGAWHQIPMTIDPNDSRIIHITLVDGGLGDASGDPNGTIIDQGGPGTPRQTVGWEGSSVNKVAVVAPWIALLAAMMAGATLLVTRRRRAQI